MITSMLFFSCDFSTAPTQLQPPQVLYLFFSNLQPPTPNFCLFNPLQTLLPHSKSQPFCFQPIPNSFTKTPGGGGIPCPSTRIKMKPQTANSVLQSARCSHLDPKGRQCRTLALDPRSGLCPHHLAEQQQELAADHFAHLTTRCHFFQTAQGINYSLLNLPALGTEPHLPPPRRRFGVHQ
jgi:hypothetical protein